MCAFFFSFCRILKYGPMQRSTCPRSANCWTEFPDRCCCCLRQMTCWGALKPPYRPEPPPHPLLICPAAASVPWPGQKENYTLFRSCWGFFNLHETLHYFAHSEKTKDNTARDTWHLLKWDIISKYNQP